ncbi:hypothetical protein M406DRAFT_67096 [Cryphonectria parasitica EP155]|uniref:Uncharacterized protein n=1 Tax=Cryphonectria parasitica (strain ATCC 38755 / EP155) TaxID=660469 RepID=A0A9P4YCA6_CRYP1|nr:uncharacterized protein M406DRAFT_67096 [Cryphonectria parasitica EP155]KAF3770713.1 hypothetical protein M406DRAFT_67096 [Cryphonectria parasitica EP155]
MCLDFDDSKEWLARLTDVGVSTYWCSLSEYPVCVTLTYEDVPGYTIYNCGGPDVITLQAVDHSLAVSSAGASTTTTSDTSSASSASTESGTSTTSTAASSQSSSSKSSAPIGAIVGGVVGGVAVIAIFVFALVFLLCRRRRNSGPATTSSDPNAALSSPPMAGAAAPAPGTYQGQPAMQQQPQQQPYHNASVQQPVAGGIDGHNPDQKPHYSLNAQSIQSLPSPGSPPPPHSPSPGAVPPYQQSTYSPPPPENQGFTPTESGFSTVSQHNTGATQQTFNEHQQHDTWSYHEMPSTKHDGELRELP